MQVIPVLDLLDGHAVRAVRGERSRYRPIQSSLCATSEPLDVARALLAATGSTTLYIADLGAILERGAHVAALAALSGTLGSSVTIWLDAGFTDFASMKALFESIADVARSSDCAAFVPVFGTETLRDPRAIASAQAAGFEPVLSLDYRHGRSLGLLSHDDSGWWPSRVIVMSLDRVGAFDGPDLGLFAAVLSLAQGRSLIGAGGIRHSHDLQLAARSGASAWLVASAIHDLAICR
ncbi:HisA/HisF-related TIM barrel protein [Candidatus Burkholderia verschuerenii]|uniref:HisA/HisF-related TIM barrel protein n=1 Tax=Candidatus Burkholderia verschuerenii TaxID=242163 RepID=UPI00067CB8E2|nr:HisA/HisF-related TIM barrel protein [Candidatus Burkholderia verschuerenii]